MVPPQQSRVLRCCSCRLFQTHQVKRSLRWTCKACGEKQSLLRTYGEGSGADCRRHVQKLNLLQGQALELSLRSPEDTQGPTGPEPNGSSSSQQDTPRSPCSTGKPGHLGEVPSVAPSSKWAQFLLSPGSSLQVGTKPLASVQRGPRPAQAELPKEGCLSKPTTTAPGRDAPEAPWTHRSQQVPPRRLCSLFSTGEDFDDTL